MQSACTTAPRFLLESATSAQISINGRKVQQGGKSSHPSWVRVPVDGWYHMNLDVLYSPATNASNLSLKWKKPGQQAYSPITAAHLWRPAVVQSKSTAVDGFDGRFAAVAVGRSVQQAEGSTASIEGELKVLPGRRLVRFA